MNNSVKIIDIISILKEISTKNSTELTTFFETLFINGKELVQEYNERINAEKKNKQKELERVISKLFRDFEKLEKNIFYMNTMIANRKRISNLSRELKKRTFNPEFYKSFNGVDIEAFSIESDDNQENLKISDESYLETKRSFISNQKERKELIAKKRELQESKRKIESHLRTPFIGKRNIKKLKNIRKMIKETDKKLAVFEQMEAFIKNYESLSDNQKLAIIEYRKMLIELQQLCSEYHALINSYNEKAVNNLHSIILREKDNTDFWYHALSRMFKNNSISSEYINKVFQQIEKARKEHRDIRNSIDSNEKNKILLPAVKFFLDNIYYEEKDMVLEDSNEQSTEKQMIKTK